MKQLFTLLNRRSDAGTRRVPRHDSCTSDVRVCCGPCHELVCYASKDANVQKLFDHLAKYWKPKTPRSKQCLEDKAEEEDSGSEDDQDEEDRDRLIGQERTSGESTPDTARNAAEDEYLAWSLGGQFKEVPDTPQAPGDLDKALEELERLETNMHTQLNLLGL